jgi:hypothetical protein
MKKLLAALFLFLSVSAADAGVSCSVPFNLTNGTTADASQVMANYNAILACLLNNTAESGANSSITSLLGLTTPISPSGGGSTWWLGGTSSGTNTVAVTTTVPASGFAYTAGYCALFIVGVSNTGPATLNVNGLGAKTLDKQGQNGLAALIGAELEANHLAIACYDGTQFQLENPGSTVPASLVATDQVLSGGTNVTSRNLGSLSGGGTTTLDCGLGFLQYFTSTGGQTLAAPGNDGSCQVLMTNGSGALIPTLSGFTVGSNTGDVPTTTLANKYILSVTRINAVATYIWKALQ